MWHRYVTYEIEVCGRVPEHLCRKAFLRAEFPALAKKKKGRILKKYLMPEAVHLFRNSPPASIEQAFALTIGHKRKGRDDRAQAER